MEEKEEKQPEDKKLNETETQNQQAMKDKKGVQIPPGPSPIKLPMNLTYVNCGSRKINYQLINFLLEENLR